MISDDELLDFDFDKEVKETKEPIVSNELGKRFNIKAISPIFNQKNELTEIKDNFLEEYNKWYIDKIKIIPFDLKISSLIFYWLYICYGYNSNNNVYLCTDSFTNNDNKKLIKKFNENNFYPTLTSQNRLFFDKEESIKFLNWIIIHNENINIYNYKFKI